MIYPKVTYQNKSVFNSRQFESQYKWKTNMPAEKFKIKWGRKYLSGDK